MVFFRMKNMDNLKANLGFLCPMGSTNARTSRCPRLLHARAKRGPPMMLPASAATQRSIPPLPTCMYGAPTTTTGGCGRWVILQHVQLPINFWNIQNKLLQHASEERWNSWNTHLKHLRKHLKTLQKPLHNICNIKTLANIYVKYTEHPNNTCNMRMKKTDKTFKIDTCKIRV
jgi:hypothetical protein